MLVLGTFYFALTAAERTAFATMLLDAGARVDIRDELLQKTAIEWAVRWRRGELLELFAARGLN